jgi:transposase
MKMKTRKRYTDEFKAQAVELAKLGKPVSEVAKDLQITADLVYRWKKEDAQSAQGGSGGQRAGGAVAGAAELRTLRREVVHLKRENDILKKAAIILGTGLQQKGA